MIAESGLAALWLATGLAVLQLLLAIASLRAPLDVSRTVRAVAAVQGALTLLAFAMLLLAFVLGMAIGVGLFHAFAGSIRNSEMLGSLFCGRVLDFYTDPVTKAVNWVPVFVLPAVVTLVCAFAYAFTFRDRDAAARER